MAVVKYDAAGSHAWMKSLCPNLAGTSGETVSSVATDAAGNVLAVGISSGTCDFGTGPMTVTGLGFVVKLDPAGNTLWARPFTGGTYGGSVAVDATGNVYSASYSNAPFDFGAGALTGADDDIVLGKFDTSGNAVWAKSLDGPYDSGDQRLGGLAVDTAGNTILAGALYGGSIDFGGGPLNAYLTNGDGFLAKLSP
ncbi:hypothetical protein [Polyangium fumosum]|uniref:Cell surface protein n=1 Tax=Polyangium fumosum TaxID=889272 RepID=A0A4U1JD88_9BACT|nr:hypothetical protein [Polyangium fumosum]TKD06541.1 hypothetical protein E8A74_18680 [Polyangium fumosum]